ncbi:PD-(D/E)XK nuclease family protein [Gemmiger sp.]
MLHFILGPSGSGKSYRLLSELRARAERGERSILIVPEQFTSSTEGVLYRTLGDSLSAYVESYSFTSLSEALLRRYGGAAVPTLTEAGRALLLRRAADSLLDKVVYYSRQRRSAAFCEKAAKTIGELKSSGITPEMLAQYAKAPGADREKLDELALIYNAYEGLLAQSAMDPADRQQRAAERVEAAFFAGRAVYIDEFDTFNAPKRALLAAMLPVADVTVSLCCDGEQDPDGGMGLFSGAKNVVHTLKRMAADANIPTHTEVLTDDRRHADAPALAELNLLLADPAYTPETPVDPAHPAITYHAAASRQAEAKAVAAEIAARARQGTPHSRMAVICRSADNYLAPLRYEFRLQGIPLFCDEATSPENTAPARAVHAALDLLRGVSSRSVLRLLKTGLVDLPETQQCALENYAYTWQLSAADWRVPFTRSAAGYDGRDTDQDKQLLADAEAARAFIMERVAAFVPKASGAPAAALTKQIYIFLQGLGAEKTLNDLAESLRAQGRLPDADEVLREWNVVMSLLDQLARLLGDEVFAPADYAELFTLLLRTTDMGHIPQSLDSVIVTTAGRMRLPETDAVFVVGLLEGEFPQTPGDQGLLTHADRDIMMEQGAELPDCFANKVLREGICFYKALTVARKYLWLSWPAAAHAEDTAPASAALTPILQYLNVPSYAPTAAMLAAAPAAALDVLGTLEQTPGQAQAGAAVRAVLDEAPDAAPGYAAVCRAADTAGMEQKVKNTAELEKLLGRSLRISPTRFEAYQSCPFGYFLQYILKAAPRKKAELAPNISGTLTHWVLENALRRRGEAFKDLTPEEIEALVGALVEEYVTANLPGVTVRMQYLLERIRRNLVGLLGFIQRDLHQSGFRPVAFELRIDDRPDEEKTDAPRIDPVQLDDGAGHTVRIVGTVDRVDAMPLAAREKTYLRVVDYKTGGKEFKLKEVYYGLDCQMLLYLFTLERNARDAFPGATAAGVEYLLADPAPESVERRTLTEDADPTPTYPMNGLLLDDESVYRAMDTKGTGEFVPLNFSAKTGKVTNSKSTLADEAKLSRIRDHLDGLLIDMAKNLYSGRIDAEPLCPGGNKSPCTYCDFRCACAHRDGEHERTINIKDDPFAE